MNKIKGMVVLLMLVFTSSVVFAGGSVERGKALFNDPSLGTNGKSCNSCHPNGARIDGRKKNYRIMGNKLGSIEDAANFCIKMALKGTPLAKDSQKMKDLSAYLRTLKGKKKRRIIRGC